MLKANEAPAIVFMFEMRGDLFTSLVKFTESERLTGRGQDAASARNISTFFFVFIHKPLSSGRSLKVFSRLQVHYNEQSDCKPRMSREKLDQTVESLDRAGYHSAWPTRRAMYLPSHSIGQGCRADSDHLSNAGGQNNASNGRQAAF